MAVIAQISLKEDPQFVMGPPVESILKNEEKRYLLLVERGDFNGVRRYGVRLSVALYFIHILIQFPAYFEFYSNSSFISVAGQKQRKERHLAKKIKGSEVNSFVYKSKGSIEIPFCRAMVFMTTAS